MNKSAISDKKKIEAPVTKATLLFTKSNQIEQINYSNLKKN